MVQLPSTIITNTGRTQLTYYMNIKTWNSLLSTARRHPDYLIIPTLETPDAKSWNYLPKEWPSKVLILKGTAKTIIGFVIVFTMLRKLQTYFPATV